MSDMNWKNWALVLVIAVGVSFELMKNFKFGGGTTSIEGGGIAAVQPYSVKTGRTRPQPQRLAAPQPKKIAGNVAAERELLEKFLAANGTGSTSFAEGKDKGAEGKKKKEEKCDEKNPKIDPKTGKPVPCKKKKEKKKEEDKKEASQEPPPPPKDEQKDSDIDSMISEAIASGELPQPVSNKPDSAFDSLEEWMRRLLNTPDAQETKRFIDHYQRNLVSAEIFYKITEMMIEDPREKMKQLGVMCAGLTPSLMSFQMLAQAVKSERSGSPPRRDAEGFLARYTDLNNLGLLERVLRTPGNSFTAVLAAQKLDQAATRYLRLSSGAGNTPNPTQTAAVKRNAGFFTRFVTILQDLTRSGDGAVKDQAGRTLSNLQTLLANSGTSPQPVPPTNTAGDPNQPGGGGVAFVN